MHIVVRDENLRDFTWQTKIPPTALCGDIAKTAYTLFCQHYPLGAKVRMLGVTVSGFDYHIEQMTIGEVTGKKEYEKRERAENAVAKIREKYGYATLQRGIVLTDEKLNGLDIKGQKEEK